jgi:chromosome segregation ATPase
MSEEHPHSGTAGPKPPSSEQGVEEDMNRVRELILGPDALRQRLQAAEVDRLRGILFGAQIEEYERRFTDMKREIGRIASEFDEARERLNTLEKTVLRRMDTLELEVRKLTDELSHERERQRRQETLVQKLSVQVRQNEETLQEAGNNIRDLHKTQTSSDTSVRSIRADLIDVRDQIEERGQVLRREFRQTEDDLRAELHRFADRLEDQKTDRKALASMLIEVATRLETGNNISGLLEGLKQSKE